MKDKIVIITGANSGIGKAATIKFATQGYTVVMACRNLDKGKKVQREIIEQTQNNSIDLMELDISSFDSIKCFCDSFKDKYSKLDILIHNAARFEHGEKKYPLSNENIELTFATNTVGPYFMTNILIDMLKASDDARILNACSTNIRHYFEPKRHIEFDNLQGEFSDTRKYNAYKYYGDSKIALLMLTFKMAEAFNNDGIKINAIQIPAIKISKESVKKFNPVWRVAAMVQNAFSALPETMADTYYHICTSDEFNDVTGKLINDKREIMKPSHYGSGLNQDMKQFRDQSVYPKYADNKDNIQKIWDKCESLTRDYL